MAQRANERIERVQAMLYSLLEIFVRGSLVMTMLGGCSLLLLATGGIIRHQAVIVCTDKLNKYAIVMMKSVYALTVISMFIYLLSSLMG